MKRGMAWLVVGTLAMIGGEFFGVRAAASLHLAPSALTLWLASALGGGLGAVAIMRVSAISPSGRVLPQVPIACATAGAGLFFVLISAGHGAVGLRWSFSMPAFAVAALATVGGAALVAVLLRSNRTLTTRADVVLLSLVLTFVFPAIISAVPSLMNLTKLSGRAALVSLAVMVATGFVTQAMLVKRMPWSSAAGPVALILIVVQGRETPQPDKPIAYQIGLFGGSFVFMWLIGSIGATIANRVFAQRFKDVEKTPDLPAAEVHGSS
ncbi:MAG TPA: hypothetical protein VGM90_31875 [Kofleriaceae bacterium]|jgi:hypothetical protein